MEWRTRGVPCAAVLCASMMLGGRIRFVIIFCAYVFPKYSAWKVHLPWNLKDLSDFVPGIFKICQIAKKRKVLQSQLLHGSGMLTRTSQQTFLNTQTVSWQFSIAMRSILTYPRLCPVLRGLFLHHTSESCSQRGRSCFRRWGGISIQSSVSVAFSDI